MPSTTRKWVVLVALSAFALGAGSVLALGPGVKFPARPGADFPAVPVAADKPAPPAKGEPADADWLPKPKDGEWNLPPSAFPDLGSLDPNDAGAVAVDVYIAKNCPRLTGKTAVTVASTDDVLRKLLKARLYQGTLEVQNIIEVIRVRGWPAEQRGPIHLVLVDMHSAATELWGGQPKELIPWLEEMILLGKRSELLTLARVKQGVDSPHNLNSASRFRLAAEAALWKAKKAP